MKEWARYIPEGMHDYLFDEMKQKRKVERALTEVFESKGYSEVETPALEFFDVFRTKENHVPYSDLYKMFDGKGRTLSLRYDMTTPISRIVATKLRKNALPIRLYYNQNVFRNNDTLNGKRDEVTQCGVELIGATGQKADVEVLVTALEAMKAAATTPFRLELGHVGFFKAIADDIQAEEEIIEAMRSSIERKDFAQLDELISTLPQTPATIAMGRLPRLFGSPATMKEAVELAPNEKAKEILRELQEILDELNALGYGEYLGVDLGMVHHIGYYTGMIFRGYLMGSGENCLAGGRYDTLSENFGGSFPSTGFAITVDSILDTIGRKEPRDSQVVRIALTKGRLEKKIVEVFDKIGIDTTPLVEKGRKLIFSLDHGKYEVVLAKAADVLTYVEHGVCDVGIVGKDTILEHGGSYYEVMDLKTGICRFAVAGPEGCNLKEGHRKKIIATKYPNVTANYFGSQGMDVEIIKIEGSVELAPLVQLSDAIVDIVETGSTLRENGLSILADVCPISARMIVNVAGMKWKQDAITSLIQQVKGAIEP